MDALDVQAGNQTFRALVRVAKAADLPQGQQNVERRLRKGKQGLGFGRSGAMCSLLPVPSLPATVSLEKMRYIGNTLDTWPGGCTINGNIIHNQKPAWNSQRVF